MRISGIYQIQSRIKPERIYVGSSVDIYSRWGGHQRDLKRNTHCNRKLQNHYNKYGKNDLIFSILICCEKDELIGAEQFYIDSKKTYFNLAPKAGNNLGIKYSEEQNRRNSERQIGYKQSQERREKQSIESRGEKNHFYGRSHTEESNEKRRQWMLAHPVSKEVREKQAASLKKYHERRKLEKELQTLKN
jgi:group I intron endonuclease